MRILIIAVILVFGFSAQSFSFSHDKLLKDLNKAADQLNKDLNKENNNNKKPSSSSSEKINSSSSKTTGQATGDFINLPKSKYLTIQAFLRDFNNKIIVLNRVSNGPNSTDVIFKINSSTLANGSNSETAAVPTDIYYKKNNKWIKEKLKVSYFEDAYFCDAMARKTCIPGAMAMYINAFDYPFAIMKTEQKSIGNTVTSKGGYKLIPVPEVSQGDISYNPQQWRLVSQNRNNDAEFAVLELSTDQNIITKLESNINATQVAAAQTQKKNEEAASKQVGFNKKINLRCLYTTTKGSNIETYQFDGKKVYWQGLGTTLGVSSNGLLVTREGSSNIVKATLNSSGMTIDYLINLGSLQAEYVLRGMNFKVLGTCVLN